MTRVYASCIDIIRIKPLPSVCGRLRCHLFSAHEQHSAATFSVSLHMQQCTSFMTKHEPHTGTSESAIPYLKVTMQSTIVGSPVIITEVASLSALAECPHSHHMVPLITWYI